MLRTGLILTALLLLAGTPAFADYTISAIGCIEPAANALGADLAKYRTYTREVLQPVWWREMKTNESSLWFGKVSIHCTVHSDGTLSDLSVTVGDSTGLLKTVCRQALLDSAPFKPFSPALVKEIGDNYTEDFIFTVRRRHYDPTLPERADAESHALD